MNVVVAGSWEQARRFCERELGVGHTKVVIVTTNHGDSAQRLYGRRLEDMDVHFTGSWDKGQYANMIVEELRRRGWAGKVPSPAHFLEALEDTIRLRAELRTVVE